MPNSTQDKSIQYSLGKICGSIEAIQEDISHIKDGMIPDGEDRMKTAEHKLETLGSWKKTTMTLIGISIALAGWLEAKTNIIGGLFNG